LDLTSAFAERKGYLMGTMDNLFMEGCVVKDKIRIWSGTKRLTPIELGMDPDEVKSDLFTLGSKYLIPKDEISRLARIRARAKDVIKASGFSFDFGTNFIPNSNLEILKANLDSLRGEFNDALADIGNRYPQMRQNLIDAWQAEAVSLAAKRNRPDLVLDVMDRIRTAFKPWDEIVKGFSFEYNEYRDINAIANEFIGDVTRSIVEKLAEMAAKMKERIQDSSITEKNLTPIRNYLDELAAGLSVFQNSQVNHMVEEMQSWTVEGSIDSIRNMKDAVTSSMDKIIGAADEHMDAIVQESIDNITSFKRKIQK